MLAVTAAALFWLLEQYFFLPGMNLNFNLVINFGNVTRTKFCILKRKKKCEYMYFVLFLGVHI